MLVYYLKNEEYQKKKKVKESKNKQKFFEIQKIKTNKF